MILVLMLAVALVFASDWSLPWNQGPDVSGKNFVFRVNVEGSDEFVTVDGDDCHGTAGTFYEFLDRDTVVTIHGYDPIKDGDAIVQPSTEDMHLIWEGTLGDPWIKDRWGDKNVCVFTIALDEVIWYEMYSVNIEDAGPTDFPAEMLPVIEYDIQET